MPVAKHLEPYFGHIRASHIGTEQLSDYISSRKAEKAANATRMGFGGPKCSACDADRWTSSEEASASTQAKQKTD